MKILNAEIINFGKFHNITINFDENLNIFLHENGWGKTTLSVFIKSMFYGMEHTTKKDLKENEKKKYMPWQGGIYGGRLTFLYNGKKYRVFRTFGLKKNEDKFELVDLDLNRKSADFTEDLGKELFGVGRETYARSVHVTLDESPIGSDDISAKLNNLIEDGDVSNFELAISAIENTASSIKAKRGNAGKIALIQQHIDEDRASLDDIAVRLKQNIECNAKIQDEMKISVELKKQQDEITKQLSDSAKYESKIRYEQLKNDVEKTKFAKRETENFFNGNVPSDELLENIYLISSDFCTLESNIKNQSATESQKNDYDYLKAYFGGDIPSKDQISNCIKMNDAYNKFLQTEASFKLSQSEQKDFDGLKQKYNNISQEMIDEQISNFSILQKKKTDLAEKTTKFADENTYYQNAKLVKTVNVKRIVFFVLATIALLCGVASIFIKMFPLGIAGFVAGILFIILGIFSKNHKKDFSELEKSIDELKKEIEMLNSEILSLEEKTSDFVRKYMPNAISEYAALTSISNEYGNYCKLDLKEKEYLDWLKSQKNPQEYENAIKAFLIRYCKSNDISSASSLINILSEKIRKLENLENLINTDATNRKKFTEYKEKLTFILKDFQTDKTKPYPEQVNQIREKRTTLENCKVQIKNAVERLSAFENNSENDIDSFECLIKPEKSLDDLQNELKDVNEKLNHESTIISNYKKIIEDNLSFTDRREDIENEIESLNIQKQEKVQEYELLLKTEQLLSKAKENLDANYSEPMKDGFNKYAKMLGSELNLLIDTDLKVSVDSEGNLYESDFLSEGYKDIINFCARMALVDALYEEVKPPIILDDPFVNLDDKKVTAALNFVKELSKENQVIYFACHKSREIV